MALAGNARLAAKAAISIVRLSMGAFSREFSLDGYTVFTSSAIAAPTVLVSPLPPRSRVRGPPSTSDAAIARSIASAASG